MFEISKANDIAILHLYGEIALLEMQKVQELIYSLKRHNNNKILIDLALVDHVHFEAVKRWALEAKTLREKNGDLKIALPNNQTRMMLKFTGADQYLKDYSSVADALLSFLRVDCTESPAAVASTGSEGKVNGSKTEGWLHL